MSDEPIAPPAEPSIVDLVEGAQPLAPPPAGGDGEEGGFDEGADAPPPASLSREEWAIVRACAGEPQQDVGNARRLRAWFGEEILHIQRIGWHVYDGRRWKEDVDLAMTRPLCHRVVEAIVLESFVLEPTEREAAAIKAAEEARPHLAERERALSELLRDDDTPKAERTALEREIRDEIMAAKGAIAEGAKAAAAVEKRRKDRRRFANTSGNKGKLDGMLAEALPYLSRPLDAFDRDPLALNVENGTLRFVAEQVEDPECPDPDAVRYSTRHRVRLDAHDRGDLLTKVACAPYDARAEAPTFVAFIRRVLPDDAVRRYVRRFLGYALTGRTSEQVFAIWHGEGRNGKSTLVDLVARILNDYATSLPISTLVGADGPRRGSEATPDLARLPGARFVRTAEPKEGLALDESLIKGLTGGEPFPMRRLNQEFVDVYPEFKLVISCNRKPEIRGNDDGIWRRVALVPFDVQIPEAEVDKNLPAKLWEERAGVLRWLLGGALDYLDRGGLDPPDAVTLATREYRDESDLVGAFVRGALEVTRDPLDVVETGTLYAAFQRFAKRSALGMLGERTFARRMPKAAAQFGFEKGKASNAVYVGVRVRAEFDPERVDPSRTPYDD